MLIIDFVALQYPTEFSNSIDHLGRKWIFEPGHCTDLVPVFVEGRVWQFRSEPIVYVEIQFHFLVGEITCSSKMIHCYKKSHLNTQAAEVPCMKS
ncbi:hypothetical protein ASH00_14465 [Arthrobacter sp. Soil782]|nr:hypothetical protein ASH00_14465 [Arthrobacter sp. Soil782]